jgi:anti-sigma-K factor RskA
MTSAAGADEPIACSLDAASLSERTGEWRAFMASSVVSVQAGDTAVRLELRESEAALMAAVDLAQREKRCCAFFEVSIVLDADRRTLVLAVPDGAVEMLASFVLLLGVPAGRRRREV